MSQTAFLDGRVTLLVGDVREQLATMEADSVDCVVTSPPYWGLRDYGIDGQLGLERTLAEHLAVMIDVFAAIKRVLKPTGTVWLNYGDCYATSPNGRSAAATKAIGNDDRTFRDKPFSTIGPVKTGAPSRAGKSANRGNTASDGVRRNYAGEGHLKPKDLCMIPNRLAILLQEAGWWIRSEIIWGKSNPMPESIRDRPATAHEKIFLLTKAARYWYDGKAVRRPAAEASLGRWAQDIEGQEGSHRANGGAKTNGTMKAVGGPRANENANGFRGGSYVGGQPGKRQTTGNVPGTNDRNLRNYEPAPLEVWNIATQPFSDAHFATFPPELAERCILAGCPKGGLVLDPFGGAGTTALVALRHHRRAALIELNPAYAEMAQARIEAEWRVQPKAKAVDFGPLFGHQEAAE